LPFSEEENMRPRAALCIGLLFCLASISHAARGAADNAQTISDGAHAIPAMLLEPIAVDEKNLGAAAISGGFHASSEIRTSLTPGAWEKFKSRAR
jgi:hypothetical protein